MHPIYKIDNHWCSSYQVVGPCSPLAVLDRRAPPDCLPCLLCLAAARLLLAGLFSPFLLLAVSGTKIAVAEFGPGVASVNGANGTIKFIQVAS